MYGRDRSQLPLMESLLRELCSVTIMACSTSSSASGGGLSDHADILEAFFNLLAQILKKNPQLFVNGEGVDLAALFQCGEFRCIFNYSLMASGLQKRRGRNNERKSPVLVVEGEVMTV
jgi:hypothetical protein